jgi:hypothetical protein
MPRCLSARLLNTLVLLSSLFFVGNSFSQVESTPPTLNTFAIDKVSVDVSENDQTITFTVDAEDDTGVDWNNPDTKLRFDSPSGQSFYINFSSTAPHIATFTLSSVDASGTWLVREIRLFDVNGNSKNYYASSGGLGAFPTSVDVSGGTESNPPILNAFAIDKVSVDVSENDQTITFTVDAEDDTGVDWNNPDTKLRFDSPSGQSFYINFSSTAPHIATHIFNCLSSEGTWLVREIRLFDVNGNSKNYYASSGGLGAFPTSVDVSGLDTDADGIYDCDDTDDTDDDGDGDGISDVDELGMGTNPSLADSDNDGIDDGDELEMGTDPLDANDCISCGPKSWWRFKLMQATL